MTYLYTKSLAALSLGSALILSACGGGGGSSSSPTPPTPPTPPVTNVNVTISGQLTYDRVPLNTTTNGLDYDDIEQEPIRQAPVELVSANGTVLASTVSDDDGRYSLTVLSGQNARVRVRSEIQKSAPNEIDMKVVDNTSGDAVYALQGSLVQIPATNQVRDLNAASGWGGTSYNTTRAAAPFALLDTIYDTMEEFIEVDPDVDFPAFNVLWSTRNRAEGGDVTTGQIGTSSFTVRNGTPVLQILGDANNDTDEYDEHVIVHEFGHYFENTLSRADSIGGPHSTNDRLDARVAFGEGWGNALSGMILEDPIYRDSFGQQQSRGFNINVENNTYASTGWYSSGSVQSILYDLYDDDNDGADDASYGLGPIYGAFTDPAYRETAAFTSIFAFLQALENQAGVVTSEVSALTVAQDINGTNEFGAGETNDGGLPDILPVYDTVLTDGTAVSFCSVDNFGDFNKHGNRRYFRINIPTAGDYRFTMSQTTVGAGDPDFVVYKDGENVGIANSGVDRQEQQDFTLTSGLHVMEAFAFRNIQQGAQTADICYNFTVEAQ